MQLLFSAWSSNLVLIGYIVSEILRFLYFGVLAWNCLFKAIFGEFGGIFPQMTSPIVLSPRRLSHKARKLVQWFNLGARSRKEQDRTLKGQSKKSQSGNISPTTGETPTVPIRTKISMVGSLRGVIACAEFQVEIFRGYDFTEGSNFPFSWWFSRGPYKRATALPVIGLREKFWSFFPNNSC